MSDDKPATPDTAAPSPADQSDAGTPEAGTPEAGTPEAGTPEAGKPPPLTVGAQYVKDLSFENPRAPASLIQVNQEKLNIGVAVNVVVQNLKDNVHEVVLALRGEAKQGEEALFLAEVHYAGLFTVGDVPKEYVAPLLYIEAPRMLFPFARAIIADNVRDGGFPPLMMQPIDFVALYQQRVAQQQSQADKPAEQAAAAGNGPKSGDGAADGGSAAFKFEL